MTAPDEDLIPVPEPKKPSALPQRIGRYELLERIGKGGMGIVYKARDTMLGRMVAVKMLVADLEVSDETRERFFREARAAGQLTHRNIITIYDFGEEAGRAYIVMELLHGEPLTALMQREPNLPLEQRVDVMMRVCEGLAFAHSRSIVHRDVKPANLFITGDGQLKILDFGVARIASSNLTRSGLIVGTPDYMSPEQVQGKVVDQRSDIFSAGSVFYQLLTGRKPFAGKSLPLVLQKVVSEQPPPLRDAEAPPELARIVARAMEKDPAGRYQQTQEMLADLARFAQFFDQQTREQAAKACDRYKDIERLLGERTAMGSALGITVASEEVAAAPILRELPLFADRGADVLRVVPFRRARLTEIVQVLREQHERIVAEAANWRAAMEAVKDGDSRMSAGDAGGALAALETASLAVPDSPRVSEKLQACRSVLAVRRADEERIGALLEQARRAVAAGQWEAAEASLRAAQEAAPAAPGIADIRRRMESGRAAEAQTRRAAVDELAGRAERALARGEFDAAEPLLREALAIDGASESAAELMRRVAAARADAAARDELARRANQAVASARALFDRGDREQAIRALRDLSSQRPSLPGVAAALDRFVEEDRQLADLARRQAEAAERAQRAEAALARSEFRDALGDARLALDLDPANETAIRVAALADARLKAIEAAERRADQVAAILARAQFALGTHAFRNAHALARQALELEPDNQTAADLLVAIAAAQQEDEARRARERGEEAKARAARPAVKMARKALAKGDCAHAIWAAENALALHPSSAAAHEILAQARALSEERGWSAEEALAAAAGEDDSENTVAMTPASGVAAISTVVSEWVGGLLRRLVALTLRS